METLLNIWQAEWDRYAIEPIYLFVILAVVAIGLYRNWNKTLLILWSVVYLWTMVVALKVDLSGGFTVVWLCAYGFLGFMFLGFLFYSNLK